MRLFMYELKKIFNWKIILLVLFVNFIMLTLFISLHIEYFPNGRPAGDFFKIEQQIIPIYGSHLSKDEAADMQNRLKKQYQIGDAFLAKNKEAVALHLNTMKKFENYDEENKQQEYFVDKINFHTKQDFTWRIQAYEDLIEIQQSKHIISQEFAMNDNLKKYVQRRFDKQQYYIYSNVVVENFKNYIIGVSSSVFLSVLIVISPIFLRDTKALLLPLQYSSKTGRAIYRRKWFAGGVSALLVSVLLLIFYGGLYLMNHTSSHFALPLYTLAFADFWYNITFLQFILLSGAFTILFALILASLSMIVSSIVRNYTSLIAIQIAIAFLAIFLVAGWGIPHSLSTLFKQSFMPTISLLIILLTSCGAFFLRRREGQRDIE